MKKIMIALFLIVNVLLFFGIMNVYKEEDFVYISQIETQQRDVVFEHVSVENNNKEIDSRALFALLEKLTKEYDLLVSVRFDNSDNNQYDIYVASNENIDQRLQLVTDTSINFNDTDVYYTSKEDSEGVFFYLLNKDLEVNIYPITDLGEMPSTMISFVSGSREDIDACIEIVMEQFGVYITRWGESSSEGDVVIWGNKNISLHGARHRKLLRYKISYLFQNYALSDNDTVKYNLEIALQYRSVESKRQAIADALEAVGLGGIEKQKVYTLSGGEQQRVAIARLLLKPTEIVLADEPTGNLDVANRGRVFALLQQLNEQGKTIVIATHDVELAEKCDYRIELL